jgi:predicted alpha-1,2-mannosidase
MPRSALLSTTRRRGSSLLAAGIGFGLIASLAPAAASAAPLTSAAAAADGSTLAPFDAVDQFIGTQLDTTQNKSNDAYGNTYPGATTPFGMVQPSPTTYKVGETNSLVQEKGGYEYTANQIRGFGMTRYSGTGCHTRFGGYEFPTMPFAGDLATDGTLPRNPAVNGQHRSYFTDFSHDDEVSQPGYYGVTTADGIQTELTATKRTAVSRFDFSKADGSTLILDASGANNRTFEVSMTIDPATKTVSGSMYGTDVCDNGNNYRAYFSTTYDQAFASYGTWKNDAMTAGSTTTSVAGDTGSDQRHKTGGWVTFADDATVTAKTGFSYTSVAAAAANAKAETATASFEDVRADAKASWEEALGSVDVTGGTDDERIKLYTALYHSLLQPTIGQDVDGTYLGYDNALHKVETGHDFFRRINFAGQGWDMYRSQAQLIAMLFPKVASDINRSIVTLTKETGKWSPGAARMSGDNYQVILSTLDAFGATDYDRQAALDSMKKTQLLPATDTTRSDGFQFAAAGFIENRKGENATSRTLEYAADDFAIAQLAKRLGDDTAYDTFMGRSQNWQNVFDPTTQHIRPRERTGFDRNFDLRNRDQTTNGAQFNQSTGYQYGWMVSHNIGELVERRGGVAASTRALDTLMERLDAGAYTQTGNYLSNEAAFATPWVYNWLQAPHKATDVLYRATTEMYNTTPKGLPGNDDEGALSAWYVFANLGIAPMIQGTANLLVTAPMFDEITLSSVGSDRVYQINAPGVSDGKKYTTGLAVDGKAQSKSWVGEEFARTGGTLDFTMAAKAGTWGTGADDVPPSYGDGIDARNNVGTTTDGSKNTGSMDLSDWSFSREALAAAGAAPGATIKHGTTGIEFTWPDTAPGQPDNWIPNGQRVDLPNEKAGSISFLGLATNGPSTGTAVVEYTDGSTQQVPVTLNDWTGSGNGNTELVTTTRRNNAAGGTENRTIRVFGTKPAALDVTKTVEAVTLPKASYSGVMHIFDVSTSATEVVEPGAPDGTPERIILSSTQDPSTSQYVTWRSRSSLNLTPKVEVREKGGEARTVKVTQMPERTVDGYAARSQSARIEDLKPDTDYEYRVASGSKQSEWFTFRTAKAEVEPFDFLYFGDAQEGIDTVWPATLKAAHTAVPDARLSLFAGDLIDTATDESQWRNWFNAVSTEGKATSTQHLAAMGNHEIGGDAFAPVFRDSFEYDPDGPRPSDAGEFEAKYGEHMASVMKDSVYYTDYQGVRFVTMNANRDDICPLITPPGMIGFNCDEGRQVWMKMQASWLDRTLKANPNKWSVMLTHQPIFSMAEGRDEDNWRRFIDPVLERNDIDLVLQGHDHTYARGSHTQNATDRPGVSTGPVYVVANAGEKQYTLQGDPNVWTKNGAKVEKSFADTSTYQSISVDGDQLKYKSVATWAREGGKSPFKPGDTVDEFAITKYDTGAKWVTEAGVEAPGKDVPSEGRTLPSGDAFDPDTFGAPVFDDDFSTDRLAEYTVTPGNGEPVPDLAVDTAKGVLNATATRRSWGNLALPVKGLDSWAMVIEPESMANNGASEDSLFVGARQDNQNMLMAWYNHTKSLTAYDFAKTGGTGKAIHPSDTSAKLGTDGRMAVVSEGGEVTTWFEKDGAWTQANYVMPGLGVDAQTFKGWTPTMAVRLDPGTISIDRVTLLDGDLAVVEPVTPEAVTFDDQPGVDKDSYKVPTTEGVEYLVGDEVTAAGTYPGAGTVTVTARAAGDAPIAEGATTTWTYTFATTGGEVPPVDPEPADPAVALGLTAANRPFGSSVPVTGTLTRTNGQPLMGVVAISVDGVPHRTVVALNGQFSTTLARDLRGGTHRVTASYAGAEGASAATTTVSVRVSKVKPSMTLKVSPKTAKAGRTRLTATVTVKVPGNAVRVNGTVKIRVNGKTVTATVRSGTAKVKLSKISRTGRVTVKATFTPTSTFKSSISTGSKQVKVTIRR